MQYVLEHFGVAVAAITGVLAARGKRVDLFGVIVLALVTAFGGGTLRDLLLGDTPVFWIRDPNFLLSATAVAVASFFAARFHEFPLAVLLVADAFALALFTMIGVKKALAFQMAPSIAIAMGVITGVVGGIIRELLGAGRANEHGVGGGHDAGAAPGGHSLEAGPPGVPAPSRRWRMRLGRIRDVLGARPSGRFSVRVGIHET